ncbi:MAG: hypothetical protein AB1563_14005, partial [Bacillota bacterium]
RANRRRANSQQADSQQAGGPATDLETPVGLCYNCIRMTTPLEAPCLRVRGAPSGFVKMVIQEAWPKTAGFRSCPLAG